MGSRSWIFTLHLEGDVIPSIWNPDVLSYLLYQKERCPTTGRLHLQGCLRTPKAIRMAALKAALKLDTIHLEPAKDWPKVKNYSKKTESRVEGPWEHGSDTQGRRSDLASPCQAILAGKREREIALEYPETYVKYFRGFQQLHRITKLAQPREKRVALFWGTTGSGKTRMVHDHCEPDELYNTFCIKTPWFDGYNGQRVALLDECGAGMMNVNMLKRILDRYPMDVAVKGGHVRWNPETVVLTSNDPLEEWYPGLSRENLLALKRRMTIFEFPKEKWLAECWMKGSNPPQAGNPTWGMASVEPTLVDDEDPIDLFDVLHREDAVQ